MSAVKALMNGVDTMCKAELVMLCEKYGIDGGKTLAQLRYTLKKYYEENGVPDQELKKAKPDPLSVAHAAATKAAAAAPAPAPVVPAGPPTCPHGAACPELHSYKHRMDYAHDGFRPPIKCRDGLACAKIKDREHLVRYAHEDSLDRICADGADCPLLHVLEHRRAKEHPGFRAQPFPCRDGAACKQLHDRGHLYKYAHDIPAASVAATTTASSAPAAAAAAPPSAPPTPAPSAAPAVPTLTAPAPAPPAPAPAAAPAPTAAATVAIPTDRDGMMAFDAKKATAGHTSLDAFPLASAPDSLLVPIPKDGEEFWELEDRFAANLQGNNEDYVASRIKAGKKPLRFLLVGAERVYNPVLEARFELKRRELVAARDAKECRERVSFHGTHPKNIKSILHYGLLRFKHPLNPCKTQADDGYFGTNKKGIYVSRYADYTLKYSNRICAVDAGDEVKVILFKTLPGKTKHIEKLVGAVDPTAGYDSHSSPTFLEWYLFDEAQACPAYVLKIKAVEDTRT
eukprot:CAMPEP_0174883202 /NCGR_PEP_ID=MMETSP1114-20130205/85149_1 /TAXON_ID=312471 /ORGANISM="Neobodo designis, Strain CCAP 1951/1" /LENGTH=512 /DNA_ID=CAMNT_0016118605 /DNA_START=99 /DNA_END=1633 /DNA_ORIENTATION=-